MQLAVAHPRSPQSSNGNVAVDWCSSVQHLKPRNPKNFCFYEDLPDVGTAGTLVAGSGFTHTVKGRLNVANLTPIWERVITYLKQEKTNGKLVRLCLPYVLFLVFIWSTRCVCTKNDQIKNQMFMSHICKLYMSIVLLAKQQRNAPDMWMVEVNEEGLKEVVEEWRVKKKLNKEQRRRILFYFEKWLRVCVGVRMHVWLIWSTFSLG